MNTSMIAATLEDIPPAKGGRPALWNETDLASFVALLDERPALISPDSYAARTTARGHAEKLRDRLLSLHGLRVSIRVWEEAEGTNAGRFRWAVIRQQENSNDTAARPAHA